jgi:hypothetical protein
MPRQQAKKISTRNAIRRDAGAPAWVRDELQVAWRDAHHEAVAAYTAWQDAPGVRGYVAYRAAQDREDAAQDALAGGRR